MKYIYFVNVVYCDVKLSNLLVDLEMLFLRIGDFGWLWIFDLVYLYYGYLIYSVLILWYKLFELLLNVLIYDSLVDMWVVGCVFVEMLLGKFLFEGRYEID